MPLDPNDPRFKDAIEVDVPAPDWDALTTKDALLAAAREAFPVGCAIRHTDNAVEEFRRRLGKDRGVVLGYSAWDDAGNGEPSINLNVRFAKDSYDSHIHPCWVERI